MLLSRPLKDKKKTIETKKYFRFKMLFFVAQKICDSFTVKQMTTSEDKENINILYYNKRLKTWT